MVDTLALAGMYSLSVGSLYAYVGTQLAGREVPEGSRLPHRMFLMWWFALAASSLNGALNIGLYRLDALRPAYYIVSTQVNLLLVVLALLGLLHYMVYIYTGSSRWFKPMVVFYVLFYLLLLAFVAMNWNPPESFTDNGWSIQTLPVAEQETPQAFTLFLVLLLVGPQIGAAVALIRLATKLDEPTPRYRVRLVGGAILAWFGMALVGSLLGTFTDFETSMDAWQYLTRVVGFSAVLTILAAYKPPGWVRRRYGIQSV